MKTRSLKTKLNLKQKVISGGVGYPSKAEGKEGDFAIRWLKGKGLFLFYKWQNNWYSTRFSLRSPRTTEDKEPVIIPVGRKPSKRGELSMDTSGKTHVSKGSGVTKQVVGIDSSNLLDIKEFKIERNNTGTSHSTADFKIQNNTGHAHLHIQTQGATYDPYVLFSFFDGEALKQWTIGIDNNDADIFKWDYGSHLTPIIPGSGTKLSLTTAGNLETAGTLTIGSIASDTAGDNYLVEVSGEVKKRTPAELLSDIGASDISFDGSTANGVLTYKDADEMSVESNLTFDSSTLTFAGTSDSIITKPALATPNKLTIEAGSGTGVNKNGADLELKAGNSTGNGGPGDVVVYTSKNTTSGSSAGAYAEVIKILGETGEIRTKSPNTSLSGELSIYKDTTHIGLISANDASGATTPNGDNLRVYSEENLHLDSKEGIIKLCDDEHVFATFTKSGSSFQLHENNVDGSADYFKVAVATNGATTISTVDAVGVLADLTIDPDGQLILNSGGLAHSIKCEDPLKIKESADAVGDTAGYGQLWVHDTTHCDLMFTDDGGNDREMLSGMILGYTDIGLNEARVTYNLTNSYAVPTDEWGVTFVAPPSGNVEIFVQFGNFVNNSLGTGDLFAGLSDANATSGYNTIGAQHEERILDQGVRGSIINSPRNVWTLTGLTSGTSYTIWVGVKYAIGSCDIAYGGSGSGHYPSFIMKATALPATIST